MDTKGFMSWFVKGFAFTILVLVAVSMVIRPSLGLAQSSGDENPNARRAIDEDTSSNVFESDGSDQVGFAEVIAQTNFGSPLVIPAAGFSSEGTDPDGFCFNFAGYVDGNGTA